MDPQQDFDSHGAGLYKSHVQASAVRERERLQQLHSYQEQIRQTVQQLQQLPKKLTHNICVPYGRHAFFPGALQHTNEVRVHLGAGYYVHCTAHEARGILERRLERLQVSVNASQKLLDEREGRLQAYESALVPGQGPNGEGVMEIRQSYEESEALLASSSSLSSAKRTEAPTSTPPPTNTSTSTHQQAPPGRSRSSSSSSSSSSRGGQALPWAHPSSAPGSASDAATATGSGSPPSAVKGGPKEDPEMDRLFARMDDLIRMEELGEAGESEEEKEEPGEGNPAQTSRISSTRGNTLAASQAGGLDQESDSDDDDDEEEEEEDGEEDDWAAAFTPVSLPLDSKPPTTITTTTTTSTPAPPTSASPSTSSTTKTTNAPTAFKKGFLLSQPATAKTTSASSTTAAPKQPARTIAQQKQQSLQPPNPPADDLEKKAAQLAAGRMAAFTGEVVERGVDRASPALLSAPLPSTPVIEAQPGRSQGDGAAGARAGAGRAAEEAQTPAVPQRVSKFKQMRQQNNNMA